MFSVLFSMLAALRLERPELGLNPAVQHQHQSTENCWGHWTRFNYTYSRPFIKTWNETFIERNWNSEILQTLFNVLLTSSACLNDKDFRFFLELWALYIVEQCKYIIKINCVTIFPLNEAVTPPMTHKSNEAAANFILRLIDLIPELFQCWQYFLSQTAVLDTLIKIINSQKRLFINKWNNNKAKGSIELAITSIFKATTTPCSVINCT